MNTTSPVTGMPAKAQRIVFLHIVKTAGTSVVEYFRRRLPDGAVFSHGDFLRYPQDEPLPQEIVDRYRFLSGHFGYMHIEPWLDGAYSFVFLRDPVERVLSLYKFCLHEDMQRKFPIARAAARLGLEGFLLSDLPEVAESLDNQQTWQLARMYWQSDRRALTGIPRSELLEMACTHLGQFTRIGLTETFAEDFAAIVRELDMPPPAAVPRQLATRDPIRESELSAGVLEQLRERMALDYELLDFARRLVDERHLAATARSGASGS